MALSITGPQALPLLIISLLMAITALSLSLWGGIKSFYYAQNNPQSNTQYFQFNAVFSNLFNCVSCICVTIYFMWLTLYPLEDTDFFLTHESIRLRVATTVSWYIGKIFLFLIFNGRLFYAFRNSKYRSNYVLFKSLNIFIIVHASASLIVGYVAVLELRNEIVANIGFNTFHIDLTILLFYLSIQFNRRMFYLSTTRVKIELSRSHGDPNEMSEYDSITQTTHNGYIIAQTTIDDEEENEADLSVNEDNGNCTKSNCIPSTRKEREEREHSASRSNSSKRKSYRRRIFRENSVVNNKEFLRIVTRSSLLLTIIIPFMISISVTWSIHRFALNTTHYSMCIALLVMALDSFIDVICVLLLFKYTDSIYNALCKCKYPNTECPELGLDYCCARCCIILARKYHNKD